MGIQNNENFTFIHIYVHTHTHTQVEYWYLTILLFLISLFWGLYTIQEPSQLDKITMVYITMV
jgi:hypothetical protein